MQFLKDEAYFCRSDLLGDISQIMYPPKNYDNIIKKLKDIIDKNDVAALLFASKICEQENKGFREDKKEKRKLKDTFHRRGLTLYNWLRSGEVFPEEFLPLLGCKNEFSSNEEFKSFFKEKFETFLDFHPKRIFVSTDIKPKDLINEIDLRACFYSSNDKLIIYSRSGTNQIAEKVINKKKIWFSNVCFNVKKERYKLGASFAIKFELTRIDESEKKDSNKNRRIILRPRGIQERRKLLRKKEKKDKQKKETDQMKKILSLFKNE